jgi:hypothetical protein
MYTQSVSNPFVGSQDTILSLVNIPHEGPTYMSMGNNGRYIGNAGKVIRQQVTTTLFSSFTILYLYFVDDERYSPDSAF